MTTTETAGTGRDADDEFGDGQPEVAWLIEELRLAEAKLARQRQAASGMNDIDRAAMRIIIEASDAGTPTSPGRLAAKLHITPGSATSLVDRLYAGGFVTISPHPSDRRRKTITPFSRTFHADHIDPLTARIRELVTQLTPDESTVIAHFLKDVLRAVTEPSGRQTQSLPDAQVRSEE